MGTFSDSIKNNIQKILEDVNTQVTTTAVNLFTDIVESTPSPTFNVNHPNFAKGLLSNQWYPSIGNDFSSELTDDTSPTGAASIERVNELQGTTEFLGKDGSLTLTNNVPYAQLAETIGWRKEDGYTGAIGPYRMVFLSIQRATSNG
jgi:hypothetical protein